MPFSETLVSILGQRKQPQLVDFVFEDTTGPVKSRESARNATFHRGPILSRSRVTSGKLTEFHCTKTAVGEILIRK